MGNKLLRSIPRAVALAALGMSFFAAVAQAAVVRLTFDPAFGPTFPNLFFAGSADIDVPDSCLALVGQIFPGSPQCPSGSVVIQNAHVDLSSTAAPSTTLETVTFAPPPITPNPVVDIVVQLIMDNGQVVGLDTTIFGPQTAFAITPDVLPNDTSMWLRFVSNYAPVSTETTSPESDGPTFTVDQQAFIYLGSDCSTGPGPNCIKSNPAEGTFTVLTTPEPGTIALLIGGLAAAGFARRRNRRS